MALSNFVAVSAIGGAPGQPMYADLVRFDLDANYATGGYDLAEDTTERDLLNVVIGQGRTIMAIIQQENQQIAAAGLLVVFNFATTKLQIFDSATGLEISNGTNLSGITGLDLLIISK